MTIDEKLIRPDGSVEHCASMVRIGEGWRVELASFCGHEPAREVTHWPAPSSDRCGATPDCSWRRHPDYPGAGKLIACYLPKGHEGNRHSAGIHRVLGDWQFEVFGTGSGIHWTDTFDSWLRGIKRFDSPDRKVLLQAEAALVSTSSQAWVGPTNVVQESVDKRGEEAVRKIISEALIKWALRLE